MDKGYEVVVIGKDQDVIEQLGEDYDCSFYCGDGAKPSVLDDVDTANTDLLLCLSDNDTSNVLASMVAKPMGFSRVLSLLHDKYLLPICEQLKLDNIILPD